MDQRYVDTVRAFKVILRNLDYLEESASPGQLEELNRLIEKVQERLIDFVHEQEEDHGLWIGEE
jgi:hypothetical protein